MKIRLFLKILLVLILVTGFTSLLGYLVVSVFITSVSYLTVVKITSIITGGLVIFNFPTLIEIYKENLEK